ERGERAIAGVIGRGPADSTSRAIGLELSSRRAAVEHLADPGPAGDELIARRLDVGDDQVEALYRAGRGWRDLRAELDRARRAGRRELDDSEAVVEGEIGVQLPPQAPVEALGAVDVGHRDDDDLELCLHVPALTARLRASHRALLGCLRTPSRRAHPGLPPAHGCKPG